MLRRQVSLIAGQYYHVFNRGNNRGDIFFERENYLFWMKRFREYVVGTYSDFCSDFRSLEDFGSLGLGDQRPAHAKVIAYVLMPNHYHVLLQALDDQLSAAMQKFSISYTKAINERFDRVGSLFQGAFEAKLVDNENYLRHLSRYIHLNPVHARLCDQPEQWEFSSYREYVIDQTSEVLKTSEVSRTALFLPVDLEPLRKDFEGNGYLRDQFVRHYADYVRRYRPADRQWIAHLLFS